MKTKKEKLEMICEKFGDIEHRENFSLGGGLSGERFASKRHEDAKDDEGKITLGKATQLFSKATDTTVDDVKEVLKYAVPNMEWHHAGQLPKAYGGGMKKTYFLNAQEICDIAKNWDIYIEKVNLSKIAEKNVAEAKKDFEIRQLEFLQSNAKKITRTTNVPAYFYKTSQEMEGKYGWFDSTYKSYKMPEYFSGWEFATAEKYHEFFNIQ